MELNLITIKENYKLSYLNKYKIFTCRFLYVRRDFEIVLPGKYNISQLQKLPGKMGKCIVDRKILNLQRILYKDI